MCGGVDELVDEVVDDRFIEDFRGGGGGTGVSWECRLCLIGGGGGTLEPWLGVGLCNTGGGGGGIANGEEMGEEGCFTGVVRMGGGGGGTLELFWFCKTGGGGGGIPNGEEMGEEGCFIGVVRMGGGGGTAEIILALCWGECWGTGGACDCVGG